MNVAINALRKSEPNDPALTDYWLEIQVTDPGIIWQVPVTKEELERLKPRLPKWLKIPE